MMQYALSLPGPSCSITDFDVAFREQVLSLLFVATCGFDLRDEFVESYIVLGDELCQVKRYAVLSFIRPD